MLRSRLGLLGLCAVVLGVMAMSASSAQAALSWLVLNKAEPPVATEIVLKEIVKDKNGKGEVIAELQIPNLLVTLTGKIDSADLTLLTKLLGKKFAITCTNFETEGIHLAPEGKLTEGGKVVFTGCEAYGKGILEEPLGCKVHSAGRAAGTVASKEGKGELVLHTFATHEPGKVELKEVLTKIEPKAVGGDFGTFLTEECVLPEANPVKGVLYVKDNLGKATNHELEHLIVQGPLTSLYVGAHTAEHLETSIDGSAWVGLTGAHVGLKWSAMDM